MHCYICVYGCALIAAATSFFSFGIGALVAWDIFSRMPRDQPKERNWSEVDH